MEPNITFSDQTHKIIIPSPRPTGDRTGLYILLLLLSLLFILIFYLIYNFIAYKRYSYSQKKKLEIEKQFNDRLLAVLSQCNEQQQQQQQQQSMKRSHSYEQSIISSNDTPLLITTSLNNQENFKSINKSVSNQYHITNQLVSDL
ncbi:unnamed protein product [Adineta steineri]|uniref:Uncharacterized protein n=1 Tax=Adineta steineri TaxID=433720 RepID=A0A815JQF9_9BILA|nr:unnamed protein product [Adineta steineri]CAF1380975.1 unnamed protein product [Adineta steineri]CAF3998186.1 unnamed protein product [Adineta steineri]